MSSLLSRTCRLSKRTFRLVRPSRNFFTFLFFLVLSGIFWLMATLNEEVTHEVEIQFCVTNVPDNVMFAESTDTTISVRVHDKGFAFLQYEYFGKKQPVKVSFADCRHQQGKLILSTSEQLKLIKQMLLSSSEVADPSQLRQLELSYSSTIKKIVEVRVPSDVSKPDEYMLLDPVIVPAKVTVYVGEAMADKLEYIMTEAPDLSQLVDSTTMELKLMPVKGVKLKDKTVKVKFVVDRVSESYVEVPITPQNVPEGVKLRLFPSRVKLKVIAGAAVALDADLFNVAVDYNDIVEGSNKLPVKVGQYPNDVNSVSTDVDNVEFLIEN